MLCVGSGFSALAASKEGEVDRETATLKIDTGLVQRNWAGKLLW